MTINFKPTLKEVSRSIYGLNKVVCSALLLIGLGSSQGIRKNYTEMTPEEKTVLVSAFQTLGDPANGIIRDIANFHNINFSANSGGIHQASTEAVNNFHAWHRYASWELEHDMQKLNPHITLPYWDWTVNRSTTDALWDPSFMGGFNTRWSLGRTLGSGSLPTAATVATAQSLPSWWIGAGTSGGNGYSNYVENSSGIHNWPHPWVGGVMGGGGSPLDPIFFFHHNNVDRLWQLWEDQEPAVKTYHTRTTLARYNGTYTRPDGVLLPSIDPDAITDSRALGIFYAGNQIAILDNYAVANKVRYPEQFTYKYLIRTSNFTVPAGKSCAFRSATGIEIQNGFTVEAGGSFTVDVIATGSILSKVAEVKAPVEEPRGVLSETNSDFKVLTQENGSLLSLVFPNWIEKSDAIEAVSWDITGKVTALKLVNVDGIYVIHGLSFGINELNKNGIHFFRVKVGRQSFTGRFYLNRKI